MEYFCFTQGLSVYEKHNYTFLIFIWEKGKVVRNHRLHVSTSEYIASNVSLVLLFSWSVLKVELAIVG